MRQGTREGRREVGNSNKTKISLKRDQWSGLEKRLIELSGGEEKRIKMGWRRARLRRWRKGGLSGMIFALFLCGCTFSCLIQNSCTTPCRFTQTCYNRRHNISTPGRSTVAFPTLLHPFTHHTGAVQLTLIIKVLPFSRSSIVSGNTSPDTSSMCVGVSDLVANGRASDQQFSLKPKRTFQPNFT